MSVCEKSKNCLLFPANMSFSNLWTISLDIVTTVLLNDGRVEVKLIRLRGGG